MCELVAPLRRVALPDDRPRARKMLHWLPTPLLVGALSAGPTGQGANPEWLLELAGLELRSRLKAGEVFHLSAEAVQWISRLNV